MTWEIKINKVSNGYLLNWSEENDENEMTDHQQVIEEKSEGEDDGELKAMEDLLFQIKEYFGVFYSKHNKKNLVIEIQETNNE